MHVESLLMEKVNYINKPHTTVSIC